jgi:hypothetical protein
MAESLLPSTLPRFVRSARPRRSAVRLQWHRRDRFAKVVLGQREEEGEIGRAAPGPSFECLEELQHTLASSFSAEKGGGVDLVGVSGLHW